MKKLSCILALLLAFALAASAAQSSAKPRTSQTVKKEQANAKNRVKQTRKQIVANDKELARKLNQLNAVEGSIRQLDAQIAALERDIKATDDSIAAVTDTIRVITDNIERIRRSMASSLREERARRQSMTAASMVLSASNFAQAQRRMSYLRQLDKSRNAKAKMLLESQQLLEQKKAELTALRQKQAASLASLSDKQQQLARDKADMQSLIAFLQSQGKTLERELKKRQEKAASLDNELEKLIAAEAEAARKAEEARLKAEAEAARKAAEQAEAERRAKAEAEARERELAQAEPAKDIQPKKKADGKEKPKAKGKDKKTSKKKDQAKAPAQQSAASQQPAAATAANTAPAVAKNAPAVSTFINSKGELPSPVAGGGTIVGRFGRGRHSALSKVEVDNTGIDIQAKHAGASALAVYDGTVSSIFFLDGFHNIVMVRHGEYITVYANLGSLSVKKGDAVKRGQPLGAIYDDVDDGGRSVLHFEVRKEKEKLNPEEWLKVL